MSKRPHEVEEHERDEVSISIVTTSSQDDAGSTQATSAPSASQEEDRRKRQKIIDQISSQTSVDPADQLRSDQLAFVPRSYQLELAELAKAGNVLVCLDTGSGKTLISVLLLQHMHKQSIPSEPARPLSPASFPQPHKVSFFLVNLVPLVHQQSSVIAGNSNLAVGKLYGELKDTLRGPKHSKLVADSWRAPHWSALLQSHQVIVSTAQCFLDALIHGYIKMDDLNLLIFDEVHHALKNHPYFRIMKYYRLAPEEQRPKIFGMTASPIFTSTGHFEEASRYLQRTMDARIHTVSRATLKDLQEVKQKPEEMVIEYGSYATILDDVVNGVDMSPLSKEMISLFGADPSLDLDDVAQNDIVKYHFETEVRPKLEHTMRQLGPLGCDLLWHSTLLEYRSRARKWVNIARDKRTLVSDDWIVDASMRSHTTTFTPNESQVSSEESQSSTTSSQPGLGLAVAHLSTNNELNSRILLHMRSQPTMPDILAVDERNASPKVLRLIEALRCFEHDRAQFCGIIFVERRQTATLLVELIKRVEGLDWIHPEFLLGHDNGSANGGAPAMDWHDQVQVLNRFRKRRPTNLLIATSIAEEGLDIQAANLVLRFDLFNRHISFLQSRGRARARESHFIIMAEKNNREHAQVILNAFNTEANRGKWLEDIADAGHGSEYWEVDWLQKLRIEQEDEADAELSLYEPVTGARLFPEDAPTLISHYAATLHSEYLKDAILAYKVEATDEAFGVPRSYNCRLELPSTAAVRSVDSGACRSKKQAKRWAAFKACQRLRELGDLDEWLMPKFIEPSPKMRVNGFVASTNPHHKAWRGSGKPVHVPAKKMDGWARFSARVDAISSDKEKNTFHATFLPLDAFDPACQPLLLLTRGGGLPATKLLSLLHPVSKRMKDLRPKSLGPLPSLRKEAIEKATKLTKLIFTLITRRDGKNGNAKAQQGDPAVLIVPVRVAKGVTEVQSVDDLAFVLPSTGHTTPFSVTEETVAQLKDRVLVRHHGFHSVSLYKFQSVRNDLTANSTILTGGDNFPQSTYLSQHLQRYGRHHSSHQVPSDEIEQVLASKLANMPLFEVTKVAKIQNLLSPLTANTQSNPASAAASKRLIVPYFYQVHPLSSSMISSALLLPSILTRYDQLLLAESCNLDLFAGELDTDLVLEALTSPSAVSHMDYERLEFFGDTFLKLVATCHTFTTQLGRTEAELHMANKAILTNVRLLKEAKRVDLGQWGVMRSCNFAGKRFEAPMLGRLGGALIHKPSSTETPEDESLANTEKGDKKVKSADYDTVKEKTMSDMVEALIGAALLGPGGTTSALHVCRVFNLIPSTIHRFSDFNTLLESLKQQSIAEDWQARVERAPLDHLQSLFSHTYRYPHLGLEAFTHSSLLASVLPSYQRLEFLGDAWLDFHIVQRIFRAHPELAPGELTALKGLLASNAALSALGVRLGLHKYIASNSAVLCAIIEKYVSLLEARVAKQSKRGEGGQYWTDLPPATVVPKAIADVVEASFASIVVDSGFDEGVSQNVFDKIFGPFYDEYCSFDSVRVPEVKRVVEYVCAGLRRVALAHGFGGQRGLVEVRSNVNDDKFDFETEAKGGEEGKEREEKLVQALLTPIWVELRVRGKVVGKVEVLAKSAVHLVKARRIYGEIETVLHGLDSTTPPSYLGGEAEGEADEHGGVEEDGGEEQNDPTSADPNPASAPTKTTTRPRPHQ